MHKNISEKIKRLAEGIMYLGAFISLVFGVLAAIRYSGEAGRIICLLIALKTYISTSKLLMMYLHKSTKR